VPKRPQYLPPLVSQAKQRDYYQTPAIMVISNIILSKGHDASEQQA
jgi:hypothetical protein